MRVCAAGRRRAVEGRSAVGPANRQKEKSSPENREVPRELERGEAHLFLRHTVIKVARIAVRSNRWVAGQGALVWVAVMVLVGALNTTPFVYGEAPRPDATPTVAEPLQEEHWYQVAMGGVPAGFMVMRSVRQADRLITETDARLAVKRGGTEVALEMAGRFVETPEGNPIESWSRQRLGPIPIEITFRFEDDAVVVVTEQGGRRQENRQPLPEGDWLTPGAAERTIEANLAAGLEQFSVRSLDPQLGLQVVETTWQREAQEVPFEMGGDTVRASRWRQVPDYAPALATTAWLDERGQLLESTTAFMGIDMQLTLADRATVMAETEPPELLLQTFVYPDRVIEQPRQSTRAVYRLTRLDGTTLELPSIGVQRSRTLEGGVAEVTVDLGGPPVDQAEIDDRYLKASTFVDHEAPAVHDLLAPALASLPATGAGDPAHAEQAEAIRAFVASYLTEKNLNALLATATEVATSRAGDCTEHSVLTAALLRAAGIPSRVVTGLIYVDRFVGASDLFGYHMWTQAHVDGRWIDLDATLDRSFDAAHIALATSALEDESAALFDLGQIVPLLGALEIEVVEVVHDAARAAGYTGNEPAEGRGFE